MKTLALIALLCSAVLLATGEESTTLKVPPQPAPTTQAPDTTTSSTTTTTSTTPSTTSTTTPSTTTTTSAKPPIPPPNTTTTEQPITTPPPPPPPTPTPKPTPVPEPKTGKWIINGTDGNACIILKMAVQFNVTYVDGDNKTVSQLITVPTDNATVADGVCNDTDQLINIKWKPEGSDSNDSVILQFTKNETKYYSLHHIEAYITPKQLPKFNQNGTLMLLHNVSEFRTSLSNSYRCVKAQALKMSSNTTGASGVAKVSDLQFQAFKSDKSQSFGYAEDCTFETPDVVPIAVGCALIALVVIVLVAYLVGRRRSQARGYLSM